MTLIFWKQSVQYWSVGMSCLWHGLIYCAQEGSLFPVVPELIALTFTTLSCHTPPASRGRTCTEKYMQWTHRHCSLKQRRKQRGRHIDHWISNDKMEARTETWRILPQKVKKKKNVDVSFPCLSLVIHRLCNLPFHPSRNWKEFNIRTTLGKIKSMSNS